MKIDGKLIAKGFAVATGGIVLLEIALAILFYMSTGRSEGMTTWLQDPGYLIVTTMSFLFFCYLFMIMWLYKKEQFGTIVLISIPVGIIAFMPLLSVYHAIHGGD